MQQTTLELSGSTPIDEPEITAYFDGAITSARGHATCGAVIKRDGKTIARLNRYIGHGQEMSVNVAEYSGLLMVFEWLSENGIDRALIHGDSEMVILQMRGSHKARGGTYVPYYMQARKWRDKFPNVTYQKIPRLDNWEADEESREPLAKMGIGYTEVDDIDDDFERAIS